MSASSAKKDLTTIFVVDDEIMLLDLVKTVLEPLGFNVVVFNNPTKALEEFSKKKPVLLVTDYAMGDTLNGLDLMRECRKFNPQQKIILVSGTVDEKIYLDSEVKPDSFLSKPYHIQNLIESVQALIAK